MKPDSDRLSAVVAVVAGGARGLGAAFARRIVGLGGKAKFVVGDRFREALPA